MKCNNIRGWLALCILAVAAGMIAGFYFVNVPADNIRLLDTALGFVFGLASTAFSFYFGTISNERKEDKRDGDSDKP